jgi:probable rRNA maturation factor
MKIIKEGEKVFLSSTLKNIFFVPNSFKKLPFDEIKNDICGKDYELSIVLIGTKKSKKLNNDARQKNYPTDILSFSISKNMGEIFITPKIAEKKSKQFGMTFPEYMLFLVIHGCLHLIGMEHGSKMERYELTHYSRYRRRNV